VGRREQEVVCGNTRLKSHRKDHKMIFLLGYILEHFKLTNKLQLVVLVPWWGKQGWEGLQSSTIMIHDIIHLCKLI